MLSLFRGLRQKFVSFAVDEIPARLIQGSRGIDNEFNANEPLYIRCLSDHVRDDGGLFDAAFRFPNFSCNRQKHGEPTDVLYPIYLDWGIATYQINQVPKELQSGDGKTNIQRTFDIKGVVLQEILPK